MRPRSIALLLLALGCALVATIGVMELTINRNTEPESQPGETQPIFVAMTDIGMGDYVGRPICEIGAVAEGQGSGRGSLEDRGH